MMMLHSTASSSAFGAHPHHSQPLLHLNLIKSMPQWMVGHPHPKPDGHHASTALIVPSMLPIFLPVFISCKDLTAECQFRL